MPKCGVRWSKPRSPNTSIEPARRAAGRARRGPIRAGRSSPASSRRACPSSTVRCSASPCRRSAQSYGAGAQEVQWVVNAYLLPLSALLLLGGALGDHFGRKRLLLIGTSHVRDHVAGLRARAEPAAPARRTRRAGRRRGVAAAQQPRVAQRRLLGREARARRRHLGCGGRRGGGDRAADRRLAGRDGRLAGDLLHQPAAGAGRDPARRCASSRRAAKRAPDAPIMPEHSLRPPGSAASPTR